MAVIPGEDSIAQQGDVGYAGSPALRGLIFVVTPSVAVATLCGSRRCGRATCPDSRGRPRTRILRDASW